MLASSYRGVFSRHLAFVHLGCRGWPEQLRRHVSKRQISALVLLAGTGGVDATASQQDTAHRPPDGRAFMDAAASVPQRLQCPQQRRRLMCSS